jgi:hypothetical protein
MALICLTLLTCGWFSPDGPQREIYISRVGAFNTLTREFSLTNTVGMCLDNGTNGYPLQIIVTVTDPTNQAAVYPVRQLLLQYAIGTNVNATAWTSIGVVEAKQGVNLDKTGAHFGFEWTPPTLNTNYLIRLFIQLQDVNPPYSLVFNANTNENDIVATGGITWEDWEVIGLKLRNNKIPSVK